VEGEVVIVLNCIDFFDERFSSGWSLSLVGWLFAAKHPAYMIGSRNIKTRKVNFPEPP
jgi:hypothetical protein